MSKRGLTIKSYFEEKVVPPDGSKATVHPYINMASCDFPCCKKVRKPGIPWGKIDAIDMNNFTPS